MDWSGPALADGAPGEHHLEDEQDDSADDTRENRGAPVDELAEVRTGRAHGIKVEHPPPGGVNPA